MSQVNGDTLSRVIGDRAWVADAGSSGTREADTHGRVCTDKIDRTGCVTLRVAGKLRHIGIGRPHAGTHVTLLIHDLHVRVVNATTGELLRELTIDPTRDYQPRRPRRPETTTAEPANP